MTRSEYARVLRLYGRVMDHLEGFSPPDQRLVRAQELAVKALSHGVAIYSLAGGTDVQQVFDLQGTYLHVASLNVLNRALLETYLLFNHIFIDSESEDDFEFRFCAWQLIAGAKREKLSETIPPQTEEERQNWRDQRKHNKELRERVRKTEAFKRHSSKSQKRLLQGRWRFPKWVEMATRAGIGEQYATALYSMLSDYAHSGGIATVQMGRSVSDTDRLRLVGSALRQAESVLSRMIFAYVDLFPEAEEAFASDPGAVDMARILAASLEIVE